MQQGVLLRIQSSTEVILGEAFIYCDSAFEIRVYILPTGADDQTRSSHSNFSSQPFYDDCRG
jgi:hypothetical protein